MKIPIKIKYFCKILKDAGFQCYLVGGAVRNYVGGMSPPSDYDFATDALPEQVISLFKNVIPTGIDHGTVTVHFEGMKFEVTTFRIDGKYTDSRHPDSIKYSTSIYADLERRDFTINAMAIDPLTDELIDPQNGQQDLRDKIIRAIGVPEERFAEDGLRVLRACRFASQLQFTIEEKTFKGIIQEAERLKLIAVERIRDEIKHILLSDKPSIAFYIMKETGVLKYIIPELLEGVGIKQKIMHKFDVFEHSVIAPDFAEKNIAIKLAALLHDIGKPRCFDLKNGEPTFYNHDALSAKMAETILTDLKFPKQTIKQVTHLIKFHMFNYTRDWTDGAIRRFIAKVGPENIQDLLKLRHADKSAMKGETRQCQTDISLVSRINDILQRESAFSIKNLDVDGNILSSKAGIPKSHQMGLVLQFLLDSVLEDPALNNEDKLIEMAKSFYESRIKCIEV
ncbi:MAG: CCA tRNA nucleotidyltransferase [Spirochaetes bacterium]|nr:CCA tRNA nucleotidyltransferase [Spirochaetota bacterium]